jgi:hypothetical protein
MARLIRDVEAGCRHFWRNRQRPVACEFVPQDRPLVRGSLQDVAAAIVAMGKPPRGTMRRMAIANGLRYASLANKVGYLRRLKAS